MSHKDRDMLHIITSSVFFEQGEGGIALEKSKVNRGELNIP